MNLFNLKISSLGYGNMQKGIMEKLFSKKIIDREKYTAIVGSSESREKLNTEGIHASLDHQEILKSNVVFLAYKQPHFWAERVYQNMEGKIVISIIAGIKKEDITKKFLGAEVVQAMPNRGSVVGEGCTFLKFSREIEKEKKKTVIKIFQESGQVYEVSSMEEINKGIALSASMFGVVAFLRSIINDGLNVPNNAPKSRDFFYKFEDLVKNLAIKYDFLIEDSPEIIKQTFRGVEKLAEKNKYNEIQASVTSKNGVTHEMIEKLKKLKIEQFLEKVMQEESLNESDLQKFAGFLEESYSAGIKKAEELSNR